MYKFAIIGCGRIAHRHAENIKRTGTLLAVCDTDKTKADAFASRYRANCYYDIDELLKAEKEVDIVSICTPNGYHAEHSIKSLQARKHVLCEKPMCLTTAAAWQMLDTEKFTRKKLFVVKSGRFNPLLKELKKSIDEHKLGTIYSFQLSCFWNRPEAYYHDWHGKSFPDGGTLYTQFSHYIDTIYWLFGEMEAVSGFADNKAHKNVIEFEDTGVASVRLQSGVLGTINWSVNTYQKNSELSLTVIAEKGTIALGGTYLNEIRYQQLSFPFYSDGDYADANKYPSYQGSMSHHAEMYDHLIPALEDKTHSISNAHDGLKTVEIIEKIYKAVSSRH